MPNTDISEYLNAIQSAESGEIVRDSVHDAIQRLATNGVSNAQTLDGHPASHFALKSDVGSLNNLDQTPIQGHYTVGVTSGGVWDAIHDSTEILARMTTSSAEDMNLYQAVVAISTAAGNISNALDRKTAEINHELDLSGTAFTRWEEAINNWDISTIKEIDLSDKEFTENTTDLPGGWADAGDGKAWKRVKVEVSPKLTSASIDELDEHYSGSVNITDPKYKDYNGFDTVSVDIADGFMDLDLGNGFSIENGWKYVALGAGQAPSPLPEKTRYFGTPENPVYGFRQVNIILDQNSRFTVNFWSEDTQKLLAVVENVPYGGQALFPSKGEEGWREDIPTKPGYYFNKWNPNPVNVMNNMNVYASYIKEESKKSDISSLSWGEIADNGTSEYLRGVTKKIYVGDVEGFGTLNYLTATLIRPDKNIWCVTISMDGDLIDYMYDATKFQEVTVYDDHQGTGHTQELAVANYKEEYDAATWDTSASSYTVKKYKCFGYDWYKLWWVIHSYRVENGVHVPGSDNYDYSYVNNDVMVGYKYLKAICTAIARNPRNNGVQLTELSVASFTGDKVDIVQQNFTCGLMPLGVYDFVDPEHDSQGWTGTVSYSDRTVPFIERDDLIPHGTPDEVPLWPGIIPAGNNEPHGYTRSTGNVNNETQYSIVRNHISTTENQVICIFMIG